MGIEALNNMCSYPDKSIVIGTWYPPGQDYPLAQNQNANKNEVLVKGVFISGHIDSYDKIITHVSLIKKTPQDNIVPEK
jgi:hypothetical protein